MIGRVLIFGTFDGFHNGHQCVVKHAAQKGNQLIVAVARDAHVRLLKNKEPKNNEQIRLARVLEDPLVSHATLSDEQLSSYGILDEVKPDMIVLGFDQLALLHDLERWMRQHDKHIAIEILDFFQQ